ncbi:hypothetical protein SASPL_109640 [Salvia splendens]|uniref:Uncharacterized protein n=1 Tax=Salvia splendens TaxID=180675 RepID=A0A8X9A8K6_SALSN|nr:hypothetical protein SASPL_109640 [Salvia splendens]
MSAVVRGKRSNFFEESPSSPPVSKRIRYFLRIQAELSPPLGFAGSPIRPRSSIILSLFFLIWIDRLVLLFCKLKYPFSFSAHAFIMYHEDKLRFLGKAFKESGDEMDSAIKRLNELKLSVAEIVSDIVQETNIQFSAQECCYKRGIISWKQFAVNGAEWVELLVGQVINASHIQQARERVAQALESLQQSICENVIIGVQSLQKESLLQKQQQLEKLLDEKTILKQAVSVQHERQKEFEEMLRLKQLVVQYQEQVRTLEANNYVLTMHLRQAQQSNSIPGRFKPDVF